MCGRCANMDAMAPTNNRYPVTLSDVASVDLPKENAGGSVLACLDLTTVPATPGCYLMRDRADKVIYVGKAKHLRNRLRTYVNDQDSRHMVKFLAQRLARVEFLITTTEKEALLLENSLIKEHRPRYNVRLRDDKTYVSVRLAVQEAFPRLMVVRRHRRDGACYFGPYSSAQAVRETLRTINRVFPLRKCSDSVMRNRTRPCLYYQMGECLAPCVGLVDQETYRDVVKQVVMLLEGRDDQLEKLLLDEMNAQAAALEFEKAAVLRDRLQALRHTQERQRTVALHGAPDRDVFGLYEQGRYLEIMVLFYRGGKMLGGRAFSFVRTEMPREELFSSFLLQYYATTPSVPAEVLTPLELEDAEALASVLSDQRGSKVTIHAPQRGEKRALVEIASRNARSSFEEKRLSERAHRDVLEQIRQALHLREIPARMECFDISTIQGEKAVGAMTTFTDGAPDKSRYRRYTIRQVQGQDDYAMLREVLLRRYRRGVEEHDLPNLSVVDGGKGQLNVALAVFKDLGIEDVAIVSIAKARSLREEGGHSPERFFVPGRKNPIILPQDSPVVHTLARLRDEAHRFGITYHRLRRTRSTVRTRLTEIPGVGAKRAKKLLTKLGSAARIAQASEEQIAAVPGFSASLAKTIKTYFDAAKMQADQREDS